MIVLWIVARPNRVQESLGYLLVYAGQVLGLKSVVQFVPDRTAALLEGSALH